MTEADSADESKVRQVHRGVRIGVILMMALLALYLLSSGPAWAMAISRPKLQPAVLAIYGPIFDGRMPYVIARPTALYIAWWRRILPSPPDRLE